MNSDIKVNQPNGADHGAEAGNTGRGLHWDPEVRPWHEPVNGGVLFNDLAALFRRFVVLPPFAVETLALWVVHTYAFELREISYLGIESPERRCGKTTLLTVLSELVSRPVLAANISSPAFFRVIEELRSTLLIDEADTLLRNDELRGIQEDFTDVFRRYIARSELEELRREHSAETKAASNL